MKPVLILGAGINGAAVARDLAINGIPVCIVDTGDVAGGATSRSSRLIHGGLRYLEYRDTALVRESLRERERLLKLAPHSVKPLRLTIPVKRRLGGLWAGFVRYSGLARTPFGNVLLKFSRGPRGLIAIRAGLTMYDRLARSDTLPSHSIERSNDARFAANSEYRPNWLCSYFDAQLEFPERFVLAMLEDSRRAAKETGCAFEVFPWHKVSTAAEDPGKIMITPSASDGSEENASHHKTISPSVIINATGAWGDRTLEALGLREKTLFAGTKGSHLFTSHQPLINALNGNGIYAEASDGRLVFILPCAGGVLIGTTDEPFADSPDNAVATSAEVEYLLQMVSDVFPDIDLTTDDVCMHHAGVRPLPKCSNSSAAAIPRGHSIEETSIGEISILTLVGGKLTTCRSLAKEVCTRICSLQNQRRSESTDDLPFPGATNSQQSQLPEDQLTNLTEQFSLSDAQAATMWALLGDRFDEVFSDHPHSGESYEDKSNESLFGTTIPRQFVRWSIQHEWCTKLEDLVERRLMLIFHSTIHHATLVELAHELVDAGRLEVSKIDDEIERVSKRLQKFYGKSVMPK